MSLSDPRIVADLLNYRLSVLLAASGAMVTRLCEGRYGITRREWRVVALLAAHECPMSPSDLATQAHLERARISRLITELVAKGLLARQADAQDKRRATVQLTADGRALYDDLFPRSVAFNDQVLAALGPGELEAFETALAKLTEQATRIEAMKPVPEKADRRHGGARRVRRT